MEEFNGFKDLRIVDNFYQTTSFFPMPTTEIGTLSEDGKTNLGSYSLCFPYYIAGKEYYAMILCCRNTSNTAKNILRTGKCSINFIPDNRKYFKEAVRLGYPGETTDEKMKRALVETVVLQNIKLVDGIKKIDPINEYIGFIVAILSVHTNLEFSQDPIADYDLIAEIKKSVNIPVIGSGDIEDETTYKKMLETGVDGVMVGRASFGNPMIFKKLNEIKTGNYITMHEFILKDDFFSDVIENGDIEILKSNENYIKYLCAKKHIQILRKYFAENFLIKYMRKHMLWYSNGLKSNPELKQKIALSDNLDYSLEILKQMILENCSN